MTTTELFCGSSLPISDVFQKQLPDLSPILPLFPLTGPRFLSLAAQFAWIVLILKGPLV